ncbi:MAG: outer membrane beta-barrel protein [Candidatus Acidiferrales bacterium]
MKKLLGLLALLTLANVAGRPAMAQYTEPRLEVGGGYTYRSWGVPLARTNMNGWNATVSFDVNNWLTATADFDGTYANADNGNLGADGWVETFMAGPRIYPIGHHKISPFVHALIGGDHASINIAGGGGTQSDTTLAFEAGGGVDVDLTKHLAVRIGEFDWEQTRLFGPASTGLPTQDNFKYKAAILFRF